MRGSIGGPRLMLRRLRELMAEPTNPQERLDKIATLIASDMVAEVCSVYALTSDEQLELYATEGLKREAVHQTTLKLGEGLVGRIARDAKPLNLADAQRHPDFAYRPETGEEAYSSFLGVPVLRGGQTLGVLVVQNRTPRNYEEEELEALQTTAMVLAEMFAAGELEALVQTDVSLALQRPHHFTGFALSDGLALGHVVRHEPRVVVTRIIAEDIAKELHRLETALRHLRASVDDLIDRDKFGPFHEYREVLESFRMFANDRGWAQRIREAIHSGLTAEAAVERVQNDTRARMLRQTDPYLRERLHDLDDLANRLLRELVGWSGHSTGSDLPADAIIVAANMGPAELLDYDGERLRGLILEEGSPSSHVTIVARALGIPTVGQVRGVADVVKSGDAVIVDGLSGELHIRPPADVERAYADKVRLRAKRQAQYAKLRDKPAITKDDVPITLLLNAGLLVDLPNVTEAGADGIGLFRTELQFMVSSTLPRINEQTSLYRRVLDTVTDRPVTFRTLDIGGDKALPYLKLQTEANPAMGVRAIRLALDRPALLRTQLRALLRAGAGHDLRIMFPMVTSLTEFQAARSYVDRELIHLARHDRPPPKSVSVGVMIEVPGLLWQLDELMAAADFVSVGSNDLVQFLLAADRMNTSLAGRFDVLSLSVMRALKGIADHGRKHATPVTLCGEMAGRPVEAMALLAVGYRAISMAPNAVGPIKSMLRALDLNALETWFQARLDAGADDLRQALTDYAADHGIPL